MKATPLKPGMGGKLASRKSKTGNPECSRAMSAWVRARNAGMQAASEVFKVLGKCRSQARMLSGAANHRNAGNEARAQVLTARANRGLTQGERAAKAKELRAARATKAAPSKPLHEQALSAASSVPASLRSGDKVFLHHAHAEYQRQGGKLSLDEFKRQLVSSPEGRRNLSRADLVQAFKPEDIRASNAVYDVGGGIKAEFNFIRAPKGNAAPSEKPFSLIQKAAKTSSTPAAQNLGKGKTPFMFDMKKGDLKGQTSLLDRVPMLDTKTGEVVSRQKAKMAAAVRAISKSTGKPVKDIGQAIQHAKEQGVAARTRGDHVAAHQWSQHEAALIAHQHGGKAAKVGGWNKPEAGEQARAAALVAKARAKGTVTTTKNLAPSEQAEPLKRISEREAMKGRRERTAAALKDFRGKLNRFTDVATHGQAGDTGYVPTSKLNFDPERFQFKQAAQGKHGVTDQFKETKKWNPELAGVISAWRDPADGKLYVVNGHHRADLANRLGVDKVRVQLLNARDAGEARAKGAIENIGEGRGTPYDAAKFLREHGITDASHLEKHGVSLSEHTAKRGLALASLHPSIFKKYEAGSIPEERAALIGGSGLSHAQQESVMKSVKKGTNNSTLRELLDNAHASGSVKSQTRDLFGTSDEEVSLAHHRAGVQAHVRDAILADKKLYGLVSKSKAAESIKEREAGSIDTGKAGEVSQQSRELLHAYDQLKNRSGPVASALSEAERALHAGEDRKAVYSRTRKRVIEELGRMLKGGKESFAA